MLNSNLLNQLMERNLIVQITDEKSLTEQLLTNPITLYCGFDPTADSLHLGHLVPLLCLRHFQLSGHRPIILIGGATGLIGDPNFKKNKRKINNKENIQKYIEKIKHQVSLFLDFNCINNSAITVNNYDWFSSMNVLTFLHYIGKQFPINQIINKETLKRRLILSNKSVSFADFSYNLLQSYDFAFLNKKYGVTLQIGGSDQWGNIISGINLTRKLNQNKVHGLTLPLITNKNGDKFGKTEIGNTIWLDPLKTSPYKFYQFWINIEDVDVYRFLKFFTFLSPYTIKILEQEDFISHKIPQTKYLLAEEVTRIVHGERKLAAAKHITTSLFTGTVKDLTRDEFTQLAQDGIPSITLNHDIDLQQALVLAQLAPSRSQARTMIKSNAISINGIKQLSPEYIFKDFDKLYDRYTLIKRGKKHYCLLNWHK